MPFTSHLGHLEGEQPYLGDLLTMVINHLLTGMILQVEISVILLMVQKSGVHQLRFFTWVLHESSAGCLGFLNHQQYHQFPLKGMLVLQRLLDILTLIHWNGSLQVLPGTKNGTFT